MEFRIGKLFLVKKEFDAVYSLFTTSESESPFGGSLSCVLGSYEEMLTFE